MTVIRRGGQLARALRLMRLLEQRRSWTYAELSGRFGVSGRTVHRDLDVLREVGAVIARTKQHELDNVVRVRLVEWLGDIPTKAIAKTVVDEGYSALESFGRRL